MGSPSGMGAGQAAWLRYILHDIMVFASRSPYVRLRRQGYYTDTRLVWQQTCVHSPSIRYVGHNHYFVLRIQRHQA